MLLDRYILQKVGWWSVTAWLLLAGVYLAFHLGDVGARQAEIAGWRRTLAALIFHLPLVLVQLAPAALLCGGALAIESLQRDGELAAMHGCGYSPLALGRPLLTLGIAVSLVGWGLAEWVAPLSEARADTLYGQPMVSPLSGKKRRPIRWARFGDTFVRHCRRHRRTKTPCVPLAIEGGPNGLPARLFVGRDTRTPPTTYSFDLSLGTRARAQSPVVQRRNSEGLFERPPRAESLMRTALEQRLQRLARAGFRDRSAEMILHARASFPWLALPAAFCLWVLALFPTRRLFAQLARALTVTTMLWLVFSVFWLMGRSGMLAPRAAAWVPVVACGILAAAVGTRLAYRKQHTGR